MIKEQFERELEKLDFSEPKNYGDYEFFSLRVSKETAKVLKEFENKERFQEKILNKYFKHKFETIEIEVSELSSTAILYEAHLLKMRDLLESISSKYDEQLSDLEDRIINKQIQIKGKLLDPMANEAAELNKILKGVEGQVEALDAKVSKTMERVKAIPNSYTLTEVTRLAGEWGRLSSEAKALLAPLFSPSENKESNNYSQF